MHVSCNSKRLKFRIVNMQNIWTLAVQELFQYYKSQRYRVNFPFYLWDTLAHTLDSDLLKCRGELAWSSLSRAFWSIQLFLHSRFKTMFGFISNLLKILYIISFLFQRGNSQLLFGDVHASVSHRHHILAHIVLVLSRCYLNASMLNWMPQC